MIYRLLAFLVLLVAASPASAGTRAVYSSLKDRSLIQIEVADNGDMRVGVPGSKTYMLLIGGEPYLIWNWPTGTEVMRRSDFMAVYDELNPQPAQAALLERHLSADAAHIRIEPQGAAQSNGRKGTAYLVGAGKDGPNMRIVISDDPTLAPVGRGLTELLETLYGMMRPRLGAKAAAIPVTRQLLARFLALGALIDSPFFRLETVEAVTIDPQRLALPARPLSRDEIVRKMKGQNPADGR